MKLTQRVALLAQAMGVDIKLLTGKVGNLANLTTTQKGSLVAALNELRTAVASASGIDDSAASTSKGYSSSKVEALIAAAITQLTNAAPAALDTLKELADAIANDPNYAATITTALSNRVRFDAAQVLTAEQQKQARDNIGAYGEEQVGDTDHDFVADYNAAKA